MSSPAGGRPPIDEGGAGRGAAGGDGRRVPDLDPDQRARLAQRLARGASDPSDSGQVQPLTRAALELTDPVGRLEALARALVHERVIVAITVEADPRVTGRHAGAGGEAVGDLPGVDTPEGVALAVHSSARTLALHHPGARPMPMSFRTVALAALVRTGGRVVLDPGGADGSGGPGVRLPAPAVGALAQGDTWVPPWRDAELAADLRALAHCGMDAAVLDVRVVPGASPLQRIEVVANAAMDPALARGVLLTRLRDLSSSPRLAAACERVELVPVRAMPA